MKQFNAEINLGNVLGFFLLFVWLFFVFLIVFYNVKAVKKGKIITELLKSKISLYLDQSVFLCTGVLLLGKDRETGIEVVSLEGVPAGKAIIKKGSKITLSGSVYDVIEVYGGNDNHPDWTSEYITGGMTDCAITLHSNTIDNLVQFIDLLKVEKIVALAVK